AVTQNFQLHIRVRLHHRNIHPKLTAVGNLFAIDLQNDVASLQTGFPGGAGSLDVSNKRAAKFSLSHRLCDTGSNVLHDDSEIGSRNFAVIHDLVHHLAREIYRNRESDSLIPTGSVRKNGGVDADQFAAIVDERAA